VLHPHAPRLGPHLLEHLKKTGSRKCDPVLVDMPKRIIAVGLRAIRGIHKDDVASSPLRHFCHDALYQIAVRVDERNAVSPPNVLERHRLKQGRFSRSCLSDDVYMGETVFGFDPEYALVIAKIDAREMYMIAEVHATYCRGGRQPP
jgi:hypothetical protein